MFDILIRNGSVIDGSGKAPFRGDIGVIGDRIAMIGDLQDLYGDRILEAEGLAVAPGFIDIHTHSDLAVLTDPRALSKVAQGVTTEVIGNCGLGVAPVRDDIREALKASVGYLTGEVEWSWSSFSEYLTTLRRRGIAINIVPLVAHGALRACVMGFEDRPAGFFEIQRMQQLLDESMRAGAFGLSSGLIYPPSCYAQTEELVELSQVVKSHEGIYASHIRNEADELIPAVSEAIEIGQRSGVLVEIAHHKATLRRNWGKIRETLPMIEQARQEGVEVFCDVYPYTAGSTMLSTLLPAWALAGGVASLLERVRHPGQKANILEHIGGKGLEWDTVFIAEATLEANRELEGRHIAEIARMRHQEPVETVLDLVIEEKAQINMLVFSISEEDMEKVLAHPLSAIGSDGVAVAPDGPLGRGKPHPRFYGTFPRVLGHYGREKGLFPLEEAIRKMTSAPAQRLGLQDRGLIAEGMAADLVIFDPQTINDRATYESPHQLPAGIHYVLVNGQIVIEPPGHTGVSAGKVLHR